VWFLQVEPRFDDERGHIEQDGFEELEEIPGEGAKFVDLKRLSRAGTF